MLTPTANASKNMRPSANARNRDITIRKHAGKAQPKKAATGLQTGRMAAMNRRPDPRP